MNYRSAVPDDSFLGQYMDSMKGKETAVGYDFWCGVLAIAITVGRSVWVARPVGRVWLNHFVIFCAESGITRKSTAISALQRVIGDDESVIGGRISPSKLETVLHERTRRGKEASAHFIVPELVSLLGREGHLAGMPGLLTDLYDCPSERKGGGTLSGGEITMRGVFVNLISASTPTWLATAINPAVIEGGFTSRVLFVTGEQRKKAIPWGVEESASEGEQLQHLKQVLKTAVDGAKEVGGISINKAGLGHFSRWYKTRVQHRDAFQASFESREDDHVLKLAAILSINDGSYMMDTNHIKTAIRHIEHVKTESAKMFGTNHQADARMGEAITRIRTKLVERGDEGILRSELYLFVRRLIDKHEFEVLAQLMHEGGFIQKFTIKKKHGRPATLYRATENIKSFGLSNAVLGKLNLDPSSL